MVTGIDSFKEWFKGSEEQYVIIGGTACDILMTEEGLDFRATKDIDLVLIIEAVDANFGKKFWEYVKQAGYEHCSKSSGAPGPEAPARFPRAFPACGGRSFLNRRRNRSRP